MILCHGVRVQAICAYTFRNINSGDVQELGELPRLQIATRI
jgi:hypothetical protein